MTAPAAPGATPERLGVVAIGRNEGERLQRCLRSLVGRAATIVYVDSGSDDGSVPFAHAIGALVVALDGSVPFTAARARNAGFERLLQAAPDVELVQFVDGDCEVVAGWLERAAAELHADQGLGVVCGRRRERNREASVYNRLCDMEWDTPIGRAEACGGDAMMRVAAFQQVGGYDPSLIAGEEPDLCLRLRRREWTILRVDAEMTLHDAAMTRFGQWWKRNLRSGHAYAEGAARHGHERERYWVRDVRSNWLWGVVLPGLALILAIPTLGISLLLLGAFPAQALRVYRAARARAVPADDARIEAAFCVLGKIPQALGQGLYWWKRLRGQGGALIEYKR